MAGPDLYLEIDERVLNEALAAGWQTGLATYKGRFSFAGDVPEALAPYAQADWRVTMNGEPLVEFTGTDEVYVHCDAKLELMVLKMIPITFDLAFHTELQVEYSAHSDTITFVRPKVIIDRMVIHGQIRVTDEFLNSLNSMLAAALLAVIGTDPYVKSLQDIIIHLPLPTLFDKPEPILPATLTCCKILPGRRLAVGIVFQEGTSLDTSFQAPKSLAPVFLHIQQSAIRQIYNLWWAAHNWAEPVVFDGVLSLNADVFIEKSRAFLTRLISLGFVQRDNDLKNMQLKYKGEIYLLNQPELMFTAPNQVGLKNLKLKINLEISINADVEKNISFDTSGLIPDKITPWKDDIQLKHSINNKEILQLQNEFTIMSDELSAGLSVGDKGKITIKAQKADFHLDFGNEWYQNLPESLINGLLKLFNQKILDHIPQIAIAPSLFLEDIKVMKLSPVLTPESITVHKAEDGIFGEEAISFGTGFDVTQLTGKVKVPGYIANTKSRKVHRVTCEILRDIRPEHREGYYVLHEALQDGYQACKNCLKGAGTR